MKYKVGDKVLIKTWEEMEAEYGLSIMGDIDVSKIFTKEMENAFTQLKSRVLTIEQVVDNSYYRMKELSWKWSDDTIKCKASEIFYNDTTTTSTKESSMIKLTYTKKGKVLTPKQLAEQVAGQYNPAYELSQYHKDIITQVPVEDYVKMRNSLTEIMVTAQEMWDIKGVYLFTMFNELLNKYNEIEHGTDSYYKLKIDTINTAVAIRKHKIFDHTWLKDVVTDKVRTNSSSCTLVRSNNFEVTYSSDYTLLLTEKRKMVKSYSVPIRTANNVIFI